MEEDRDNIPSAKENMEGSANDMMASTSEQNMEGSDNIASTSSMNMEEDSVNSSASTSEQKMDLGSGSGSDLERCSNCKAIFSLFKVSISSLVDAKKLFPQLSGASNFLCMDCVKMVKSKTKSGGFNKKRSWAGSGASSVDSTPPPSKRDKTKGPVGGGGGGGGVAALPPAPTSTQNTEGPVRYVVVIPKKISSVAASKQNEDSVNVTQPCKRNMNRVTTVGPSASMLNMAGSVKKPPTQNMGASVEAASTSKPNVEGTNSVPLTLNDSPPYNDMPMPCTSEQSTEGSFSKRVRRCSLCKKKLKPGKKGFARIRISVMVDLKTAQILLPHLSPEEFVCYDPCQKWVKSKTKPLSLSKREGKRTWIGFSEQDMEEDCVNGSASASVQKMDLGYSGSDLTTTPPPSKRDKTNATVDGGGGVFTARPPAPTSTQNTEGSVHYVVIPKTIPSAAPSKQNEDSVDVTKPCKPNMNRDTTVGPSASILKMAGSVKKPPTQNMGASVKTPSTSKPNVEGTVKVPPTFIPTTKGSLPYVVGARLPTVLPTNWNVKKSANGMQSTSEQSAEGSGSEAVRRCGLCKKELKPKNKCLERIRISKLVDLKTAQVLLPHLSPEEFICRDPCEQWVRSKTTQCAKYKTHQRTWTGFSTDLADLTDHNYPNTNSVSTSDGPSPAPKKDMPSASEQSSEGSASSKRCSHCSKELTKSSKGFKRTRISKLLDKKSAQVLFPHLSPEEFICQDPCLQWVKSKTTRSKATNNRTNKRTVFYPLPCKEMRMDQDPAITNSVSTSDAPPAVNKKRSARSRAINSIRMGHYYRAIRTLAAVPAARRALSTVCREIINKECIKLSREKERPFRKQTTRENLSSFSWKETNAWVEEKAPLTVQCLRSMFPQAKKIAGQQLGLPSARRRGEPPKTITEEEVQQLLEKRIGMVMSIALFTRTCRNSFVQSVIGVEMWREGCSEKVFKIMNSLGVSQAIYASRQNILRLQDDHDKEVKLWKGQVEEQLGTRNTRIPAFSLTWDRVRITSQAKHERLGGNKPTIWAFRFAHRNRITFRHLQGPPKKAVEVSPDSILPSKQTYEALRQRMKTIVMRIIVDNLTALEGLRSKVVWHIPHLYSKQMDKKSNVVNLGAVPVDWGITKGDREIMDSLIEYVPTLNEKPRQVLCCSDGLNVDSTEEPSQSTARQRFEGLVDAPPEHHKESLCYQDITKMLFSEKSLEARGSLSQLKSVFAVRGHCIESQVKDTIQRVWDVDFITFVTSAYITLYAATEYNLDTVDQQPSDFPTDTKAQMEWLSGLAHRLVDLVWMPPPQEDINAAAATASLSEVKKSDSCFCGAEKPGEPLVQCCSNLCEGVWFHEGCARMVKRTDPSVTQDWFCSPECQGDGTYIYCYCKEQRGGQMVQCALMDQCRRHEWYHKDCLSQNESEQENAASEEFTWYCSEMCFIASDADDHVLNYTKALVWEGLYNMTRRDAIREGDGEAMTDFWKMDMVLFWARNHLKDFTTCHRLLTGIEGFYPEHIRQDLKWNRVANLEGKPGGNISLDLVNQLMNVEFKESLGRVSDHYNIERMKQCGMMVGAFGSTADRPLIALGAENGSGLTTSLPSTHYHKIKRRGDITKFVAEYKKDHLFRYIPGRAHQGFEKFAYEQKVKTPNKMGTTMRKLAQDMDQHQ